MKTQDASEQYFAAVRAGDRQRAFSVVDGALEAGLDLGSIYLEVFQPALREIGRLWAENQLTVAEEHLATAITTSAMLRLYHSLDVPESAPPTLLAASVEREQHEIGLRMLCDLLDLGGWDTTFLGSAVPTQSLVRMVQDRRPDVVALSVSLSPHLPALQAAIAEIRSKFLEGAPTFLVGGRLFLDDPGLARRLGADLVANDAVEAVRVLRDRFR